MLSTCTWVWDTNQVPHLCQKQSAWCLIVRFILRFLFQAIFMFMLLQNMVKLSSLVLELWYGTKKHFPNPDSLCGCPAWHWDVTMISQCRCTEHTSLLLQKFCTSAGLHRKDWDLPRENHIRETWLLTLVYQKEFHQNTKCTTSKSPQEPKTI